MRSFTREIITCTKDDYTKCCLCGCKRSVEDAIKDRKGSMFAGSCPIAHQCKECQKKYCRECCEKIPYDRESSPCNRDDSEMITFRLEKIKERSCCESSCDRVSKDYINVFDISSKLCREINTLLQDYDMDKKIRRDLCDIADIMAWYTNNTDKFDKVCNC